MAETAEAIFRKCTPTTEVHTESKITILLPLGGGGLSFEFTTLHLCISGQNLYIKA